MNLEELISEVQHTFDFAYLTLSIEDYDKFVEAVKEIIYN